MRPDRINDPLVLGLSTGTRRRLHLKLNGQMRREDLTPGMISASDFRNREYHHLEQAENQ